MRGRACRAAHRYTPRQAFPACARCQREPVDLLIEPRWLLPMTAGGAVLEGHAVALTPDASSAVGPAAELSARYAAREHVRREQPRAAARPGECPTRCSHTLLRAACPRRRRPAGAALRCAAPAPTSCATARAWRSPRCCAPASPALPTSSPHPEETARAAAAAQMRASIGLPVTEGPMRAEDATAQARARRAAVG